MLKRIFYLLLTLCLVSTGLLAQVTTSNIGGLITGDNNQPLVGAAVKATHTPTGTVYTTTTLKTGRFVLNNVQPGGPYTIEVTYVGYGAQRREDIFLNLGETGSVDIALSQSAQTLSGVTVSTTRQQPIAKGGVATVIGRDRLANAPTVGRNLVDFVRLTPEAKVSYGGGVSIAGQNNRYNQIMIDGAVNNDVFGLAESGTNGGQTNSSPISIDAIDAFQIGISPYDVSLGNFTGGSINAITKSGTNKFAGSAYYIFRNQDITGKTPNGLKSDAIKLPDFEGKIYGFTLGGPIIKNKLFFFLSGELQRDERPQPFDPSTFRINTFKDSVALIANKLSTYGYDPGDYVNIPDIVNSDKIAAKFTWNINPKNRLNLSYRYTASERYNTTASSTTRINYFNNGYLFPSTTNSASVELNSTFTRNLSNKLLLTYTNVLDDRDPLGKDFPRVTINSTNGTSYVFGTENFSTGNQLKQNNIALYDEARWTLGKHSIKAGVDMEFSKSYNLFVRDAYGNYTYNSVRDFVNDARPAAYSINFSLLDKVVGDGSEAGQTFKTFRFGAFVGDDWNISPNFQLTYGVRVDNFTFITRPLEDTFFNNRALPVIMKDWDVKGARSGVRPDPNTSVSPRVGFTYRFPEENLTLRGGFGYFTGRVPLVWPGGVYNNTGISVGGVSVNNPNITFRSDPFKQYTATELAQTVRVPSGQIDLIAQDFKLPKVLKMSLGMDKKLTNTLTWSVDLLYTKNVNEISYLNVFAAPGIKNQLGQDVYLNSGLTYTRYDFDPVTTGVQNPYATGIFIIRNADGQKGYAYNASTSLDKAFNKGWAAKLTYSYGDSYSIFDGTSSQNNSQWRFVEAPNGRNVAFRSRSDFAQLHRITAYVSKRFEYANKNLATTFTLFYNGQSGSPYSYVYSRSLIYDQNGANGETNDLVYVPKDLNDWSRFAEAYTTNGVTYSVADQWNALNTYIENDAHLKTRRGQFAERNGAVLPFSNIVDLKLQQDFALKTGGNKNTLSVIVDMFNFGNFLNRDWGRIYRTPGVDQYSLISMEGYTNASGVLKPRFTYRNMNNRPANDVLDVRSDAYNASRWRGQFTIRYTFN